MSNPLSSTRWHPLMRARATCDRARAGSGTAARASRPPAVVVGADVNGLGVVRSLAREGVPTYLADCAGADPAMRTRHPVKIAFSSLAGAAVVEALLALRERFSDDPVLFLTREATVEAVSGAFERIAACYRISLPEAGLMKRLMDKAQFQALAEQHGFAIPRAVCLRGAEDLARGAALEYPCVLKPIVKTPAYDRLFKKAYKIESPEELRTVVREIAGAAEMIVQEWIEGGDDCIYFCLQYRERSRGAAISFAGRKLRSWPPATGGTASCMPAPEHEAELVRLTDGFFAAVGFFGIGSIEFKRDSRTGRFMMIEPTVGRTDFQEEIATLNGVNIPYAAYCGELGRALPQARRVPAPAAWAVARIDRWSCAAQHQNRKFPGGLRCYDAFWRADDPLPWCSMTAQRIKARLAALARRS